jgi:hypothetical protein
MATTRRADMFIDLTDDPRENGPTLGDERARWWSACAAYASHAR